MKRLHVYQIRTKGSQSFKKDTSIKTSHYFGDILMLTSLNVNRLFVVTILNFSKNN